MWDGEVNVLFGMTEIGIFGSDMMFCSSARLRHRRHRASHPMMPPGILSKQEVENQVDVVERKQRRADGLDQTDDKSRRQWVLDLAQSTDDYAKECQASHCT